MLYAGLDLSRKRVDVCLRDDVGCVVERNARPGAALFAVSLFQQTATSTRKIEILGSWQVCAHHGRAKLGEFGEVAEGLRLTAAG